MKLTFRDRVSDPQGRIGTVTDPYGCDASPKCQHGRGCTTVVFDGDEMQSYVSHFTLTKVESGVRS